MGKWNECYVCTREIVEKFSYFKDWENTRLNASKILKGSQFSVKDHFPTEIEEREKRNTLLKKGQKAIKISTQYIVYWREGKGPQRIIIVA